MMRRLVGFLPSLAIAALITAQTPSGQAEETACESHGTAVDFVASPAEAAKVAKRKQKLVFVLHVSGLFEEPDYT